MIKKGYENVRDAIREMPIDGLIVNPLIIFEEPETIQEIEYGDRVVFDEKQQKICP